MTREREQESREAEAKRSLERLSLRWPRDPAVFQWLLIAVLVMLLVSAWFF